MRHFPASEEDRGLHLIAVVEKAQDVVLLGLIIVLIYVDAELHLFDRDDLLVLLGGTFLLFFFVEILAVVLNFADWRIGIGRDLDQIKTSFTGYFERFEGWYHAELVSFVVNDADFAGANALIGAD